jgi:hypothetical protein
MDKEKAKYTSKALYELSESCVELHKAVKFNNSTAAQAKKLWRGATNPTLLKSACLYQCSQTLHP